MNSENMHYLSSKEWWSTIRPSLFRLGLFPLKLSFFSRCFCIVRRCACSLTPSSTPFTFLTHTSSTFFTHTSSTFFTHTSSTFFTHTSYTFLHRFLHIFHLLGIHFLQLLPLFSSPISPLNSLSSTTFYIFIHSLLTLSSPIFLSFTFFIHFLHRVPRSHPASPRPGDSGTAPGVPEGGPFLCHPPQQQVLLRHAPRVPEVRPPLLYFFRFISLCTSCVNFLPIYTVYLFD